MALIFFCFEPRDENVSLNGNYILEGDVGYEASQQCYHLLLGQERKT